MFSKLRDLKRLIWYVPVDQRTALDHYETPPGEKDGDLTRRFDSVFDKPSRIPCVKVTILGIGK